MSYAANYTTADIAPATTDTLTRFVIAVIPYVSLIVIVGLAVLAVRAYRKHK